MLRNFFAAKKAVGNGPDGLKTGISGFKGKSVRGYDPKESASAGFYDVRAEETTGG